MIYHTSEPRNSLLWNLVALPGECRVLIFMHKKSRMKRLKAPSFCVKSFKKIYFMHFVFGMKTMICDLKFFNDSWGDKLI